MKMGVVSWDVELKLIVLELLHKQDPELAVRSLKAEGECESSTLGEVYV